MDQIRKFGEQTSRILEFKPEGLEGQYEIKMTILFLDFFGSNPSKMDQTRKFGEQTSRILEFKPKGLDFQCIINLDPIV